MQKHFTTPRGETTTLRPPSSIAASSQNADSSALTRNGQKRNLRKARAAVSSSPEPVLAWDRPLAEYLAHVEISTELATLKDRRSRLGMLVAWAKENEITLDQFRARHIDRYLTDRAARGLSQTTRRHDAVAAKAFLAWAHKEEYLRVNPLAGYQIPKAEVAIRYIPSAEEIALLLKAIPECWSIYHREGAKYTFDKAREFYAARDLAIVTGLIATGCRISEMLALKLDNYRPEAGEVEFYQTKTHRTLVLPLSPLWAADIDKYLKVRPRCDNPYLFVQADGGSYDPKGQYRPIPLTTWAKSWDRYMARAGLKGWSRHNLRHYAATHMAVQCNNLVLANAMLGHSDFKTTQIYVHKNADLMQQAYRSSDPLQSVRKEILISPYMQKKKPRPKLL